MKKYSRRDFLLSSAGAGGLVCGGCLNVMAGINKQTEHKFLKDSGKTMLEVYEFAAKRLFVPRMVRVSGYMGRDRFIELMEKAGDEIGAEAAKSKVKELGGNSWADFIAPYKERKPEDVPTHTFEIAEETPQSLQIRITECIWADAFKNTGAEDIGLAAICHPDYAYAYTFNPKIKLFRTKTLMTGDDCCNHKWVYSV
ncbi:L-2-amino-thiazoline-4-carboxylic acid hydrolase [candidate division KSB1 bacterium]